MACHYQPVPLPTSGLPMYPLRKSSHQRPWLPRHPSAQTTPGKPSSGLLITHALLKSTQIRFSRECVHAIMRAIMPANVLINCSKIAAMSLQLQTTLPLVKQQKYHLQQQNPIRSLHNDRAKKVGIVPLPLFHLSHQDSLAVIHCQ